MDERERVLLPGNVQNKNFFFLVFLFFFQKSPYLYYINSSVKERWKKNGRISPPVCAVVERKKKTDARDFFAGFLIRLCVCTTFFCVFERERDRLVCFLAVPISMAGLMMNRLSLQRRARYVQQIQEQRASVASICPAASTAADFFFLFKLNFFNSFMTMLQTSCIIVQPQVKKEDNLTSSKKRRMF